MSSDHDETSLLITAVSAPVQQQKRSCRRVVDVSAARRGYHTMRHIVYQPRILAAGVIILPGTRTRVTGNFSIIVFYQLNR